MNNVGTRRWWALGAITVAVVAVGLDATVLSVALPTLSAALNASESDLQWFSAAYLLVLAAAMLPVGLLGDRYGRKKVMLVALMLFGAGSIACASAPSSSAFIAARVLLGIAGAGVITMAVSAVTVLFSEEERPRAVGIWVMANFLALPIGPILGGWLLTNYWWGWVFLINVPIVVLGLIVVSVLVPESRSAERPGLDPVGVALSSAGLAAVTFGLIKAGQNGWSSASGLAPLFAGLIVLAGFVYWERRLSRLPSGQPLVDLALFRSRSFTCGTILMAVDIVAITGVLFTMPQYFQAILGTNAQGSGFRLLPLIVGFAAGAGLADRLAARIGAKFAVALGFAILATGMFVGAATKVDSVEWFTAVWTAVCGAGIGLSIATAASAAISQLSANRSGVGAAVIQALQKLGAPFGAALLGSVLNTTYQAHIDVAGLSATAAGAAKSSVFAGIAVAKQLGSASLLSSVRVAFVDGIDVALLVAAGIAVACIVFALVFMPRRAGDRTKG